MSSIGWRGTLVGLAVGIAVVLTWLPSSVCEGEGFSCLGTAVITIFAMPVVALVVGLAVASAVRLPRPWLLALLGPFAGFGLVRTSFSALDPGAAALAVAAVLITLAYAVIALLLRPGASVVLRVLAVLMVAGTILLPGVVEGA